jgi:hypothetical protein
MKGPAMQRDRVVWAAGRSSARWRAVAASGANVTLPLSISAAPAARGQKAWVGSGRFNQSRRTKSQEDGGRPKVWSSLTSRSSPRAQ